MTDYGTSARARARTEEMTSSRPTVVELNIDKPARDALLKIEGIALDLKGLLDISMARHVEPYQQDIAVSAARSLAGLIGVTCHAATSESIDPSISLWVLGGQA